MNKTMLSLAGASCGVLLLMGAGCPLIPEIEDKVVELAVGSSMTIGFQARGEINDKSQVVGFQIDDEIDIQEVLDDAGVDVSDVKAISFAGAAYRVTKPDPNPSRMITNTTVTVSRTGGPQDVPFVVDFEDEAGVAYDFRTLDLAGTAAVTLINDMLADLLREAQGIPPLGSLGGSVTWTGTSEPVSQDTNFDWEIRLDVTILGEVEVEIPG